LLAVLLVASPAAAQAPPGTVRLEYNRGAGAERCPAEQAFRDAVGADVARQLFTPDARDRLVVTIARSPRGYEGSAELRDASGAVTWARALPPTSSCAGLVDDLTFAISVKLDPATARKPTRRFFGVDGEVVPIPETTPPPPPSLPPDVPDRPAPPPSPSPIAFRIGAATWMDLATSPRPAFGLTLDAGFRVSWFSLAVEGRWDPPASSDVGGTAELTTTRFMGALVPCGHYRWFLVCAVGEVGPLKGTITGEMVTTGTQTTLYAAVGGRVGAEIPVAPHLAVSLAADALGAAQRTVFRVDGHPRWNTPAFAGGVGAGLLASFP
jgi:hypothetical protein